MLRSLLDGNNLINRRIAILEPKVKLGETDRTWCFWHKSSLGDLNPLVHHSWSSGKFIDKTGESCDLDMGSYNYHIIRSEDFYAYGWNLCQAHEQVDWISASVDMVSQDYSGTWKITAENEIIEADWVLDSRPPDIRPLKEYGNLILQHFRGWWIESKEACFDPSSFTMMDYSHGYSQQTAFFYVLPVTPHKALIEYTFFDQKLLLKEEYDHALKTYIKERLGIADYRIVDTEQGIIPMSNYPFEKGNALKQIKVGTAGGWVRPNTGYSFRNCLIYSAELVERMNKGDSQPKLWSKRSRLYDALLLDILARQNEKGPSLFSEMYTKVPAHRLFQFLDDETNLWQEIRVMSSLNPAPWLRSIWNLMIKSLGAHS